MKIKKLTLCNIASIEKAEIDFENGLNDAITGNPASIFLISGDTGAGKSVILDGISMALYKTTPRLLGVSNVKKNTFTDTDQRSISINDIRQYTRLGISDKDDSYSEVVFDGNDGKEYWAKLELGITRNGNYCTPKWSLVMPTGETFIKDKDIQEIISDAVGLSFEQFSRMAMLAQGQFASFLTGDKKERESILEKLTFTEHFSEYGEAINRLFKKAEDQKKDAQKSHDTIEKLLLKEADLEKYKNDLLEFNTKKGKKENEKKVVDEKLENVKSIENNKGKIEIVKRELKVLEDTYRTLTSDLLFRQKQCEVLEENLKQAEEWLEKQKDKSTLYRDAGKVDVKLDNLKKEQDKKDKAEKEKSILEGLIQDLQAKVDEKADAETKAKDAVQKKQDEIDRLTEKREQLKPKETNDALTASNDKKNRIEGFAKELNNLSDELEKAKELEKKIKEDEKSLEELGDKKKQADDEYINAKEAADKAQKLLVTMQMSVEETLVNLRKRLSEEHTETCPLCGQHISELHVDEDFKALVTPLQEEQNKAAFALKKAEEKKNAANEACNKAEGALKTQKAQHEKSQTANAQKKAKLDADAKALGLDSQQPLLPQIEAAQKELEETIKNLKKQQDEAESCQKKINELLREKRPLDEALEKATKERTDAEKALTQNGNNISTQAENIKNADDAIRKLLDELHPLLDNVYPDWEKNIDDTRDKLEAESDDYLQKEEDYKTNNTKVSGMKDENIRLSQTRDNVLVLCPKWKNLEIDSKSFPCKDIQHQWTTLHGDCKSKVDDVKKAIAEIAARMELLQAKSDSELPDKTELQNQSSQLYGEIQKYIHDIGVIEGLLNNNNGNIVKLQKAKVELDKETANYEKWNRLNSIFGGTRFRTLVQTYILRPLLNNANIYLCKITDRYTLTCSEDNEQLSILVLDNYNRGQVRSATLLSGGERFMISLALSLALSALNRPDMNVNILFIDEGFGTLDEKSLDSVMSTLEKLQTIAGLSERRVGIISHREELEERIPVQIQVEKKGQGRSQIRFVYSK